MNIEVRRLRPSDDRRSFFSGDPDLDRFFKCYASSAHQKHVGYTYVAASTEPPKLLGFFTVATAHISVDEGAIDSPTLLVLRIARFGVSSPHPAEETARRLLLKAALLIAKKRTPEQRYVGVMVDAQPRQVSFFDQCGFQSILGLMTGGLGVRPRPLPMFLPFAAITSAQRVAKLS